MDNRPAKGSMCTGVYICRAWRHTCRRHSGKYPHVTLLHWALWRQQVQTHTYFQDRLQVSKCQTWIRLCNIFSLMLEWTNNMSLLFALGVVSLNGTIRCMDTCVLLRWRAYVTLSLCPWTNEKAECSLGLNSSKLPNVGQRGWWFYTSSWIEGLLLLWFLPHETNAADKLPCRGF